MAAKKEKKAGFFDTYEDEGFDGSAFLTKAEKEVLIEEGVAFPVTSVHAAESKFGPRWIVGVEIEGEPRLVGFSRGMVFSRDRLLVALEDYLAEDGAEPPECKITLVGRSQILGPAEGEVKTKAKAEE
jgi:hypothetical protein